MSNKKNDMIELQETNASTIPRMTEELHRKKISKESKSLKFVLTSHSSVNKYSWEIDGVKVGLY